MVEAMDRSADPCQDFYQFACGGWMRKNPLPDGRSRWSTFNSIWEQNQALLKHLLGTTGVDADGWRDRRAEIVPMFMSRSLLLLRKRDF